MTTTQEENVISKFQTVIHHASRGVLCTWELELDCTTKYQLD